MQILAVAHVETPTWTSFFPDYPPGPPFAIHGKRLGRYPRSGVLTNRRLRQKSLRSSARKGSKQEGGALLELRVSAFFFSTIECIAPVPIREQRHLFVTERLCTTYQQGHRQSEIETRILSYSTSPLDQKRHKSKQRRGRTSRY